MLLHYIILLSLLLFNQSYHNENLKKSQIRLMFPKGA